MACDKTTNDPSSTAKSITIKDLPGDPTTGFDQTTGMPIGDSKKFTFLDSAIARLFQMQTVQQQNGILDLDLVL